MATKDVYILTSKRAPWKRAGIAFASTRIPVKVDASSLSADRLALLKSDPAITVEAVAVEDVVADAEAKAKADADAAAKAQAQADAAKARADAAAKDQSDAAAKAKAEADAAAAQSQSGSSDQKAGK